ncbi:MAG: BREX-4 system phosphatase PglZ [Clostridia bacterium]|nr:BREX-4 system phosphatase PglZ [Clostridia bacterium]
MTEQQEIIKLILDDKKKSNTYDRYPVRFLFMKLSQNSEDELITLVKELSKLSVDKGNHINDIQFINLHTLLSFEDGWITKSHLLNFIASLNPNKDYIITGFSELIRFYSRNDLEALIISFMTNIESVSQKNKQRIYFVCYSLFEKIAIELRSNSRNESIDPILKPSTIVEDEQEQICVYYASSTFDSKYFQNSIKTSSQWLSLYKLKNLNYKSGIVCISDTLVTLYEKAKPDNFVSIEKLDNNFKLLTNMFKMKLKKVNEDLFKEDFWKFLFDMCYEKSCFDLKKITYNLFNVKNINSDNFVELFLKANLDYRKLLYLFLLENSELIDYSEYLIEILNVSKNEDFSSFEKNIVSYFDMTKGELYFKARKHFVLCLDENDVSSVVNDYVKSINTAFKSYLETKIFSTQVMGDDLFKISVNNLCEKYKVSEEYFRSIFSIFYDTFLSHVLLCITAEEKRLTVALIQNSLINVEEVKNIYPNLIAYIGNPTSTYISNSLQWMAEYFYEYRLSKILNRPTEKYSNLIQNNAQDFPKWYIEDTLKPVFEELKNKKYDILIALDGVGAEYFEYILYLLKKQNKFINYANMCKCFLPSTTDVNKSKYEGKYNEWITSYDKDIIHGTFYRPDEIINASLDKIKEIIEYIVKKYKGNRVAIISDHGATASGKILSCKKKYSFESEHEGRCMKVDSFSNIPDSDTHDYYKYSCYDDSNWVVALQGYSLSDNPKRESHGGATLEEVIVPCVIFSDHEDDQVVNYSVNILSSPLSGLNRFVIVEILPPVDDNPILEEENGTRHVMVQTGYNTWRSDINEIKTQMVKIITRNQEIELLVKGTMGIIEEGDGFDD